MPVAKEPPERTPVPRHALPLLCLIAVAAPPLAAGEPAVAPADTLITDHGPLMVHPFGHASLVLEWRDRVIAVDPVGDARRYRHLPRPHLILVTHRHGDHFDADAVRDLAGERTVVITPRDVAESIPASDPVALANGESHAAHGIGVTAVAAYNRTDGRLEFHPRGRDNGYVLELNGARVYVSGDTEDIPEQDDLGRLDAAFLCLNLPWTMSVDQAIRAATAVRPRVLYPYHFRNGDGSQADLARLERELAAAGVCEVRVLTWY
jgi:L-ascorbate metabolism protein UlaG (beta-lactamase superfamily)